jgi:hypothetical protein
MEDTSHSTVFDLETVLIPLKLKFLDYNIGESCLKRRVYKIHSDSRKCSGIKLNKLVNKNLDWIGDDLELNTFHTYCGVTIDIIKISVYTKLSHLHDDSFMHFYENSVLDLNTLGWMLYHGVEPFNFSFALDFRQKADSEEKCVICNATRNVDAYSGCNLLTTISPDILTGNRMHHCYESENGYHYVIWHLYHSTSTIDTYRMTMSLKYVLDIRKKRNLHQSNVYVHSTTQYGHGHVHIIGGEYHQIRAMENLSTIRRLVKESRIVDNSEFYQPIKKFYANCNSAGKSTVLVSIFTAAYRVHLNMTNETFINFINIAYYNTIQHIKSLLI